MISAILNDFVFHLWYMLTSEICMFQIDGEGVADVSQNGPQLLYY